LLADLIQRVVATRLEPSGVRLLIVAEIGDLVEVSERLHDLVPDFVIVGQVAAERLPARLVLTSAQVLTISADPTRIIGPGPNDWCLSRLKA